MASVQWSLFVISINLIYNYLVNILSFHIQLLILNYLFYIFIEIEEIVVFLNSLLQFVQRSRLMTNYYIQFCKCFQQRNIQPVLLVTYNKSHKLTFLSNYCIFLNHPALLNDLLYILINIILIHQKLGHVNSRRLYIPFYIWCGQ